MQSFDPVAREAFAQCLDDRNATSHRRFIGKHNTCPLRRDGKLGAVKRDQGLVRSHNMTTRFDGRRTCITGGSFAAPDQFEHDIRSGFARHNDRVVKPRHRRQIHAAVFGFVAGRNSYDLEGSTAPRRNNVSLFSEEFDRARADRPETGHGNLQCFTHSATAFI